MSVSCLCVSVHIVPCHRGQRVSAAAGGATGSCESLDVVLETEFGSSARAAASLQPVLGSFAAALQGGSVRPSCQVGMDKERG